MNRRILSILCVALLLPTLLVAQTQQGPYYARIANLRPHDGKTVEWEAGYMRHLNWHRRAGETWVWYGWNVWAGEHMRWFAYATFGHTATSLDNPVNPAEDELDTISNITPHVEFMENALYEYLPGLSRGGGTGVPTPSLRLECTRVDLVPGSEKAFEGAIGKEQAKLQDETLWYRMVVGGAYPRYVRLRPRQSLSAVLDGRSEQALPDETSHVIAKTTIEVWTLKPLLSLGVELPPKSAGSK